MCQLNFLRNDGNLNRDQMLSFVQAREMTSSNDDAILHKLYYCIYVGVTQLSLLLDSIASDDSIRITPSLKSKQGKFE